MIASSMAPIASALVSSLAEDLHPAQVRQHCAHRAKRYFRVWSLGSRNVRLLLDVGSCIETARMTINSVHAEERRIDLVVQELERYQMAVIAFQATKWLEMPSSELGRVLY